MEILKQPETRELQMAYTEKTGSDYPGFNHDDFAGITDYINTLKKGIKTGVPWKWNGDGE
jgi:hypothetical protein